MTPPPARLLATSCVLATALGCGLNDRDVPDGACGPHTLCGGPTARIEATPKVLHLEPGSPNTTTTSTTVIENTGLGPLEFFAIRLEENPEDDVDELSPEGFWPAAFTLEPGDTLSLTVRWTPRNDVRDTGRILISNNDPTARNLEVPITTPAR